MYVYKREADQLKLRAVVRTTNKGNDTSVYFVGEGTAHATQIFVLAQGTLHFATAVSSLEQLLSREEPNVSYTPVYEGESIGIDF